jgi:DNA-binding LacI/PurR family transcriptional regulator
MKKPSTHLPRRSSLPVEVVRCLRERLTRGDWVRLLPGELELARELQVGRNTIRAALAVLEKDGLICTTSGKRREVLGKIKRARKPLVKVAVVLLPAPWQTLPSATLLLMDALRSRLHGAGWQMQMVVEAAAFRRTPSAALESLTARHPSAVWILYRSTVAIQRWFEKHRQDTVVAGSCHSGLALPQVDINYRVTCRHAAGRLTGMGHHRLAVLAPVISFPGDEESLKGFREGAGNAEVIVLRTHDTRSGVIQSLRTLLSGRDQPTAIFTFEARHAVAALTYLSQQGVAIPSQMSLLSRNDDPLLTHLVPEPARYERLPDAFAKKLAQLVISVGNGLPSKQTKHLIMPTFVRGETLGRPPVLKKNR